VSRRLPRLPHLIFVLGLAISGAVIASLQQDLEAAEQGNADAQFLLGAMYEEGRGVPQNLAVAYALFNLSATNDPSDRSAFDSRRTLSKRMTPSQLKAGQNLTIELMKPGNFLKALDAATGDARQGE